MVPSARTASRSPSSGSPRRPPRDRARGAPTAAARARRPPRSRRAARRGRPHRRGAASAGRAIVGWWGRARRSSGASGTCRDAGRMTGALRYCAPMARIAALEGVTERSYWQATMPALPDRRGATLPDTADVVVVGGGFTGLSAARRSAELGASVVLLEAERLGWGASTRNGGMIHPGYKTPLSGLIKQHGPERGERLYRESIDAYEHVAAPVRGPDRRRLRPVRPRRPRVGAGARGGLRGRGGAHADRRHAGARPRPRAAPRGDRLGRVLRRPRRRAERGTAPGQAHRGAGDARGGGRSRRSSRTSARSTSGARPTGGRSSRRRAARSSPAT